MAFLGRCYGCRVDNHDEHTETFDTPPEGSFICGGGLCICKECCPDFAHLDRDENGNLR